MGPSFGPARERGHTVHALDRAALDVTDAAAVRGRITELRPETVVHCAAYTAVDGAEQEEEVAMHVNRDGTSNVAIAAAEVGAAVFLPSTDYVFDGRSDRPYRPDDAVRPVSAYGRSKVAGESAVKATDGRWTIVRTSWLYGGPREGLRGRDPGIGETNGADDHRG